MPTTKNVTNRKSSRQTKPARDPRSNKRPDAPKFGWVVTGEGQTTHVLVPIDEYERLVVSDMAKEAVAELEDESIDWVDADDVAVEFARDAIVAARKKAKLTQKQLGDKVGMPQSQISRIERRPDRTHVLTLEKLAKALNVDVSVFLRNL
jgi:ribosome-binding protein aMBF1 (putative translation factor)